MKYSRFLSTMPWCLALALFAPHIQSRADTYAARISATNFFAAPLVWVGGRAPDEVESKELWSLIEGSAGASMTAEDFLARHADSPWAASLRANLALQHRARGRYTLALEEWEQAWSEVKADPSVSGRRVAEFTVAPWSELLASLGRTEALAALFTEAKGWTWQSEEWRDVFQRAGESYYTMMHYPGVSYRCGTMALANLAREWQPTNQGALKLINVPSPTNGFPMSVLVEMSATNQMGLVPVERSNGSAELVVPSVVHWRQNHYAAILRRKGSMCWVADPTFGRARWMQVDYINEEASGKFLVPSTNVPAGWRLLAQADTEKVFGKGQPATIHDWDDRGCDRAPGGRGAAPPSSVNAGGNQSVCVPCLGGMARWWVSEPYCNLQIADEPLSYNLSDGSKWSFRWTIKQRDQYRPGGTAFMNYTGGDTDPDGPNGRYRGMGKGSLSHNWLSQIVYHDAWWDGLTSCGGNPDFIDWEAVVFLPDGGVRVFTRLDSPTDSQSQARLIPLSGGLAPTQKSALSQTNNFYCADNSTNGFRLVYPDGSEDIYSLTFAAIGCTPSGHNTSRTSAYLTKRIDPHGRTTTLCYELTNSSPRIKYIVDFDGRTNEFQYLGTNDMQITQVKDPYGRVATFGYDNRTRLTNSVDTASLRTGLNWVTNSDNASIVVSRLVTPYGTTRFTHVEASSIDGTNALDQGNAGGHNRINRSVVVDEPDGAHEVYVYRYETQALPASYATNEVPSVPGVTFDNGGSGVAAIQFRNSFHWGKKQLASYPSNSTPNPESLTDYGNARLRHWLDGGAGNSSDGGLTRLVTGQLSLERAPSPGGTNEGQKTWYSRANNSLVSIIAVVLPDGTTRYTKSTYGDSSLPFPTSSTETYTDTNGAVATRVTSYSYGTNHVDLAGVTYPDSSRETNRYNALHQVTNSMNAAGESTSFSYAGSLSKLAAIIRPNGFTTAFDYYTADPTSPNGGMLQTISETGIARTVTFTWTNGQPRTVTDERGLNITNTWDALDRLTSQRYSDSTFISNRFDKLDLFATKDRLTNWTYFGHDAAQRLTVVTNANTNVTRFAYCGCGSLEAMTNALLEPTLFTYDLQLRRTDVTLADTSAIHYRYDSLGRVTNVLDGANRTRAFSYNNQGLVNAVSNAFGQEQRIVYDIRDLPVQITDAAGVTVTNTFDALGRLLTRSYPDNGVERFVYGTNGLGLGQLIYHTNQLGAATLYGYDIAGRLAAVTNANTDVTRFVYDAASDLRQLIDGKNQTNKWNYDVFGRVTNKVDASGQTVFGYSYDANNRLTNRWTPAKGNTGYAYDPVGNLRAIDYPSSTDIAFDYDPLNRIKAMTDAAGASAFTYTKAGQLSSEGGLWSNATLTNVYSQLLRTSSTLGTTWTNGYGYDAARRLNSLSSGAGSFGYEFFGPSELRGKLTLPNGAFITNTFDGMAQLTNTALFNSSLTNLNAHAYLYDQAGQRSVMRAADNSRTDYAYDPIGQLKVANPYTASSNLITAQRIGYGYDAAGNLAYRTNDATVRPFLTDKLNQLTNLSFAGIMPASGVTTTNATNVTVNGLTATLNTNDGTYTANVPVGNGTNTLTAIGYERYGRRATNVLSLAAAGFQYDANGNMLSDGKRAFAYDDENQLVAVSQTNQWLSQFIYDGLGRRRKRLEYTWTNSAWNLTNEVRYVYDGALAIQERDSSNNPKVTYTRGLDLSGGMQGAGGIGGLLARTDASGSAFYHADGNGNITALINSTQALVASYYYDPFGNVLSAGGSLSGVNEMLFSSKPSHRSITLFEARPYLPSLGRFAQADPMGEAGGINLHRFVGNDPVGTVDPLGLYDGNFNRPPATLTMGLEYSPVFRDFFTTGTTGGAWNPGPRLEPDPVGVMFLDLAVGALIPVPGLEEAALLRAGKLCKTVKTTPGKYTVGIYDDIRGTVPGLDAHHVGQKAVMGDLIPGYNPATAPAILVPKVGHTRIGPNGRLSTSTEGFTSARDVIARDIRELRRVYPDVPNSQLQELIQMNKKLYPSVNR